MNKVFTYLIILSLLASSVLASRDFTLPKHAKQLSDTLYDLGEADVDGRAAHGYAIVHKNGNAKPGTGGPGAPTCYGFLASGARWKTTESYILDATNDDGLSGATVANVIASGTERWDANVAFDVFGVQAAGIVDGVDSSAPDGKNEVLFGAITDANAIAVTTVWGYFSGPTRSRQLLEWDMIFDDDDFQWGDATVNASVMDFENIAVHEIGHSAGMADLYTSACAEQTMYGYATEGETKKRDLNTGDITGIQTLYK